MRASPALLLATSALLAVASGGCTQVRYLSQAAAGQCRLSRQAVDIDRYLQRPDVPVRLRALLGRVPSIKAFGERHGLRRTRNYTRYVDWGRPEVVWVVSACEPLRFSSRVWRFPIVGSITYLGYFERPAADAYAARLGAVGWDVDVRRSRAYSTLGWFRDPVISTMLVPGEEALGELANVVLHESLHATYYVKGQSILNESVASFMGDRLAVDYLDETVGREAPETAKYLAARRRGDQRRQALREAFVALEQLYRSAVPAAEKQAVKARLLEELRSRARLARPVNNATLVQYKTYGSGLEELAALLQACGGSWPRWLRTLERWRPALQAARAQTDAGVLLRPLLPRGCEG